MPSKQQLCPWFRVLSIINYKLRYWLCRKLQQVSTSSFDPPTDSWSFLMHIYSLYISQNSNSPLSLQKMKCSWTRLGINLGDQPKTFVLTVIRYNREGLCSSEQKGSIFLLDIALNSLYMFSINWIGPNLLLTMQLKLAWSDSTRSYC